MNLTPELIIACGTAIAGVIAAWTGRNAKRITDLERSVSDMKQRVAAVESERDEIRHLFRLAVQHIREWLAWARDHQHGDPQPGLPDELRDEV